jgi:hypothetical protein
MRETIRSPSRSSPGGRFAAAGSGGMLDHVMRTDAFVPIKILVACYFGLAVLGFGAAIVLRDQPRLVNTDVWVHSGVLMVTSSLMYLAATLAARGSRSAFLRLRVASILVPLAIVVLIVLPDPFPVWMKVQNGLCALTVAGVALLANRSAVRAQFAR